MTEREEIKRRTLKKKKKKQLSKRAARKIDFLRSGLLSHWAEWGFMLAGEFRNHSEKLLTSKNLVTWAKKEKGNTNK